MSSPPPPSPSCWNNCLKHFCFIFSSCLALQMMKKKSPQHTQILPWLDGRGRWGGVVVIQPSLAKVLKCFSCSGCRPASVFVPFAVLDTHHPSLFPLAVPCAGQEATGDWAWPGGWCGRSVANSANCTAVCRDTLPPLCVFMSFISYWVLKTDFFPTRIKVLLKNFLEQCALFCVIWKYWQKFQESAKSMSTLLKLFQPQLFCGKF